MPSSVKSKLLKQIEYAVRANILINDRDERKLIANADMEGEPLVALTIFIGITAQHGIPVLEVCDYLCIEEEVYLKRLQQFVKRLQKYYEIKTENRETELASMKGLKRFITKYKLVSRSVSNSPPDLLRRYS